MNIDYTYYKKRSQFGSTCIFIEDGPNLVNNILPDRWMSRKYLLKPIVNKAIQLKTIMSSHEVNTYRPVFVDRGMYHDQGGWPKDLNIADEEAVQRYRNKLMREENFVESMKQLIRPIEHAILQNNAINIYQHYFEGMTKEYSIQESQSQIRNSFCDPTEPPREVSRITWSPDKLFFAAAYCNPKLLQTPWITENTNAYVWNVEIPSFPLFSLDSGTPLTCIEWNVNDKNFILAGMLNGQIGLFDQRKAPKQVEITNDISKHRDPVRSTIWINSKTGMDFFSTSADGYVKWWDCRNLSQPTDTIILDITKQKKILLSIPASTLEYDSNIPAKYLVGTENGYVIGGNRKGVNDSEKLPWNMKAHSGPIYSVHRNSAFLKIYLTVGDHCCRIWSEECKESPIIWTSNYKANLTCGEWSRGRHSVFLITRDDGYLDVWDLLLQQRSSLLSIRVSSKGLSTLRMEDQGQFVVVGDQGGQCSLIQFSEGITTHRKNDKMILGTIFERESHREKLLESRMRELRLTMKLRMTNQEIEPSWTSSKLEIKKSAQPNLSEAEDRYWDEVQEAMFLIEESKKNFGPSDTFSFLDYDNDDDDDEEEDDENKTRSQKSMNSSKASDQTEQ